MNNITTNNGFIGQLWIIVSMKSNEYWTNDLIASHLSFIAQEQNLRYLLKCCGLVVQCLALFPHSKKVPGWIDQSAFLCRVYMLLPCVCMGFFQVLLFPQTDQRSRLGSDPVH